MEDLSRPPPPRSVASPFGGMENWFTEANVKKRNDEIRVAIYSALALGALCLLSIGAYYSLIVLEPFLVPLFWALLTGIVLFPYKAALTESLKNFLLQNNDEPAIFSALKAAPRAFSLLCDALGEHLFFRNAKAIALFAFFILPLGYYFYEYCFQLSWAFEIIDYALNIWRVLGQVVSWPILLGLLGGYLGCVVLLPTDHFYQKVFLITYCNVTWTIVGCTLFHTLPLPLFYLGLFVMSFIFYLGISSPEPDPPGGGTLRNYVYDLLKSFNHTPTASLEETEDKEEQERKDIVSSTPFPPSEVDVQPRACMETPIAAPHPGVSALRRHNARHSSSKLLSYGKPRRVLVCRRDSTLQLHEEEANASYVYISWVLWACCIVQLWVHPVLLHLLPFPLSCCLLKKLIFYLELNQAFEEKGRELCGALGGWYEEKAFFLVPHPLRYFGRIYFKAERRALKVLPEFADVLVTGTLILSLIFGILLSGIFVSFQLYHECSYIVRTSGELFSQMSNSSIFGGLGIFEGTESYMETAYTQGRSYISNFLQQNNISDKDDGEFERDVLNLFDRMYQYWLDRNDIGPHINEEALASSVEDIASRVKSNFSFAFISSFAQENMGMITSVLEHAWVLLKGNVGLVCSLLVELLSVLLTSGSGLFNFIIGLVVYFTALFYLLSASDRAYIPLVVLSELSVMGGDDFASAMNKAIKSVFIITFKMAAFYGLWTYLTHTLFSASVVMVPVLAATFLAAVPVAGQFLVAIPAALELLLAKGRFASALCLVLCHFAPMCLVDASIYAEVKRGIHPWITGLSIVGGIYCFGVPGAIYGPLIVCAVYVVLTVYTGFMAIEQHPPAENIGSTTTGKTPNLKRSDTVL